MILCLIYSHHAKFNLQKNKEGCSCGNSWKSEWKCKIHNKRKISFINSPEEPVKQGWFGYPKELFPVEQGFFDSNRNREIGEISEKGYYPLVRVDLCGKLYEAERNNYETSSSFKKTEMRLRFTMGVEIGSIGFTLMSIVVMNSQSFPTDFNIVNPKITMSIPCLPPCGDWLFGGTFELQKKNIYSRADGNGVTEDSNKTRRMDIKRNEEANRREMIKLYKIMIAALLRVRRGFFSGHFKVCVGLGNNLWLHLSLSLMKVFWKARSHLNELSPSIGRGKVWWPHCDTGLVGIRKITGESKKFKAKNFILNEGEGCRNIPACDQLIFPTPPWSFTVGIGGHDEASGKNISCDEMNLLEQQEWIRKGDRKKKKKKRKLQAWKNKSELERLMENSFHIDCYMYHNGLPKFLRTVVWRLEIIPQLGNPWQVPEGMERQWLKKQMKLSKMILHFHSPQHFPDSATLPPSSGPHCPNSGPPCYIYLSICIEREMGIASNCVRRWITDVLKIMTSVRFMPPSPLPPIPFTQLLFLSSHTYSFSTVPVLSCFSCSCSFPNSCSCSCHMSCSLSRPPLDLTRGLYSCYYLSLLLMRTFELDNSGVLGGKKLLIISTQPLWSLYRWGES
ncbi:hypothetical protein VP01_2223g4 [Puccinia sorghi]|uniref:Uncharacterized protein n=1 Tax=Puccinia sorghi TaxID=27349 RepID=A0A0L6V8X0_9BASI|nr:hypothetical protein VP01_2223g4 [Puccinia sorghi]